MPSDRRLHPLSILFSIGRQFTAMLVPLVVVIAGRGSDEDWWSIYGLAILVPYTVINLGQYWSFRYRYEPAELVIRRGLIFRSQRHIPYSRIQNIDAVENLLHRLTGVVDVKIQTGGGSEPEATLSVLTAADLAEMRQRVFGQREGAPADARPAAETQTLLELSPRDLALYAVIENRGFVVIAAALGLLWELSATSKFVERYVGEEVERGVFRRVARTVFVEGGPPIRVVLLGLLALVALLLVTRVISILWAFIRLNGYKVVQVGEDLRTEYGLLTRITGTVPVRRIQTVTIRDTPLHRMLGRASISVATAGGVAENDKAQQHREWIAPIIRADDVPRFLATLLPGTDLSGLDWRPVDRRAFRRMVVRAAAGNLILALIAMMFVGVRGLWLLAALMLWSIVRARRSSRYLAWATTTDVVAVRHGAFVQRRSIAPLNRIQVVEQYESPFDRRLQMGRVSADTAGGGGGINVPYMRGEDATQLFGRLSAAAADTEFRW